MMRANITPTAVVDILMVVPILITKMGITSILQQIKPTADLSNLINRTPKNKRESMASKDNGLHEAKRHNTTRERSPEWDECRDKFMTQYPTCAVCGSKDDLEVHHIFPFHYCVELGRGDLELDPRNLITLCATSGQNHHHLVGHFDDWQSANIKVRENKNSFGTTEKEVKSSLVWRIAAMGALKPLDKMSAIERAVLRCKLNVVMPNK